MLPLAEALLKAESFLKESEAGGYFLCSVFASMSGKDAGEWILHLCGKNSALDCYVNNEGITIEESQSMGDAVKLDVKKVKVSVEKAIETAGLVATTTLITLHGSPPVWTLNFITPSLMVTTVGIDAETGKITRKESVSILKKG